jgi:DNA-binding TFAR19-related protein (PDSD5 family)
MLVSSSPANGNGNGKTILNRISALFSNGQSEHKITVEQIFHILNRLQAQLLYRKQIKLKLNASENDNYDIASKKVRVSVSNRFNEELEDYSDVELGKWFKEANLTDETLMTKDQDGNYTIKNNDILSLFDAGTRRAAELITELGRVSEFKIPEGGLTAEDVERIIEAKLAPIVKQTEQVAKQTEQVAKQTEQNSIQIRATQEGADMMINAFGRQDDGIMKQADCFKSILLTVVSLFNFTINGEVRRDRVLFATVREKMQQLADQGVFDLGTIIDTVNAVIVERKQKLLAEKRTVEARNIHELGFYGINVNSLSSRKPSRYLRAPSSSCRKKMHIMLSVLSPSMEIILPLL